MTQSVQEKIKQLIHDHAIVLFMKGTPEFPQCGFSQRVANILNEYGVSYASVNVLLDPEIREGIKVFSNWPTIPQLYINGEFIGGCDITSQLHKSGELSTLLTKVEGR